jgi:hypothetical protein
VQRRFLVRHPAALQDLAASVVQRIERLRETVRSVLIPLLAFYGDRRVRFRMRQIRRGRVRGLFLIRVRRRIERQITRAQTLLHVRHFGRGHTEIFGDCTSLTFREPAQVFLEPAQVEEQLALRFRRRDFHETPIAQHILVNLGANPMHRERHQAHTHRRVEALHRLHESDIAFLNQIAHG